jgi:NifU-like protein involved in Fe-S cluster formation
MTKQNKTADVISCSSDVSWLYSDIVKDHFFNPRNILIDDASHESDGVGIVGSPACGDMMVVWITVDKDSRRITECVWRTFGCASAIASTSMMSVMATEGGGMLLRDAKHLTPEAILERLGGLPDRKYHCSVLGHQALREAVLDYEEQLSKIP